MQTETLYTFLNVCCYNFKKPPWANAWQTLVKRTCMPIFLSVFHLCRVIQFYIIQIFNIPKYWFPQSTVKHQITCNNVIYPKIRYLFRLISQRRGKNRISFNIFCNVWGILKMFPVNKKLAHSSCFLCYISVFKVNNK